MTQLESQLEAASSAGKTVQSLGEKVEHIAAQMASMEERMVNLTRLIKLLQNNGELYEQELQKMGNAVKAAKVHDTIQSIPDYRNVRFESDT